MRSPSFFRSNTARSERPIRRWISCVRPLCLPLAASRLLRVWVALRLAVDKLMADGLLDKDPIDQQVAAISCGIYQGTPVLDLDYIEDSNAGADANFVLLSNGNIAEAQATAEGETYDEEALLRLLRLARIGCNRIFEAQRQAVGR